MYYSEQIDITDDFANGFVESLRVESVDQTYFAAARAEREGGDRTTFVKGVYTACEPCADKPEKPPFWQVKAAKIIVDQREKMVYFENASLGVSRHTDRLGASFLDAGSRRSNARPGF